METIGREMYVSGEPKTDASLHQPMLANFEAEQKSQQKAAVLARSLGVPAEMIPILYPMAI